MYSNQNNDLVNCQKIDYYSFKAIATSNEVKPGQVINGWLMFQWGKPLLFNKNHNIDINKVRYTFTTIQGHSISKVIVINQKAKKLGSFANKYVSAWSISEEKYDLSEGIIIATYSKEKLNAL